MQVSPLRYASVEMTDLWWGEGERFAPSREYPTHHDGAVMNGAPSGCGGSVTAITATLQVKLGCLLVGVWGTGGFPHTRRRGNRGCWCVAARVESGDRSGRERCRASRGDFRRA